MRFNTKFVAFQVLDKISTRNAVSLLHMAIISEVNYYMHNEHGRLINQEEFEIIYDAIEKNVTIKDYTETVNELIYLLEEKITWTLYPLVLVI